MTFIIRNLENNWAKDIHTNAYNITLTPVSIMRQGKHVYKRQM